MWLLYRPKSTNLPTFHADLASSDLCVNPPDLLEVLIASYATTLSSIYDQHAPLRTKTIVTRPRVPWYTKRSQTSEKEG